MSTAFELIDGVPNYNLYVGGKWVRSSRNEAVESRNPATGELFAKVQQAGAAETELTLYWLALFFHSFSAAAALASVSFTTAF